MITHLRELARLSHSSLRGWDREHVLQLLAAVTRPRARHTPCFLDTPFVCTTASWTHPSRVTISS